MNDLVSYETPTVAAELDPQARMAVGVGVVLGEGDDPIRGEIWLRPQQAVGLVKALLVAVRDLGEPVRLIDLEHLLAPEIDND